MLVLNVVAVDEVTLSNKFIAAGQQMPAVGGTSVWKSH
jgi:hypothetical protein